MEVEIRIPQSLRDIKLHQWQKFQKILEQNKGDEETDFVKFKMLEIFCGLDLDKVRGLPLSTFEAILIHLNDIFSQPKDRVNQFRLKGTDDVEVTFGLIPDLDKMSYGEFVDLEKYIFDWENAHKAMAVLYRPVLYSKNWYKRYKENNSEVYHIERYRGTEHLSEVMKDAPLDVYLGSQVFFYNLAKKLGLYTMDYTLQQLAKREEVRSENPSERNGEIIKQSIHSHREMLQDLMKLQNLMSTNV